MFNFFKRKQKNKNDLYDKDGNLVEKSSIVENRVGERFLKIDDNSCGIIIHGNNNVEVIFSKLYDKENQKITANEETLMALALFMKQPGFMEMLLHEFRRIASEKISTLVKNTENKQEK